MNDLAALAFHDVWMWANTPTDEPNYGEALAGMSNMLYGTNRIAIGGAVVAAAIVGAPPEAVIPIVGPVTGGAAFAYRSYQFLSGARRVYRGKKQLHNALENPVVHTMPLGQVRHLIFGSLPAGDSIEGLLGGLP
jgi:hypothetical protein